MPHAWILLSLQPAREHFAQTALEHTGVGMRSLEQDLDDGFILYEVRPEIGDARRGSPCLLAIVHLAVLGGYIPCQTPQQKAGFLGVARPMQVDDVHPAA